MLRADAVTRAAFYQANIIISTHNITPNPDINVVGEAERTVRRFLLLRREQRIARIYGSEFLASVNFGEIPNFVNQTLHAAQASNTLNLNDLMFMMPTAASSLRAFSLGTLQAPPITQAVAHQPPLRAPISLLAPRMHAVGTLAPLPIQSPIIETTNLYTQIIERARAAGLDIETPDEFECSITFQIMMAPAFNANFSTPQRAENTVLLKIALEQGKDPWTRAEMRSEHVTIDRAMQTRIHHYVADVLTRLRALTNHENAFPDFEMPQDSDQLSSVPRPN